MTFQNTVVKYEVNKEECIAYQNPLLSRLKTETVSQFQKKILQFYDDLFLKRGFIHYFAGGKPQKLNYIRIAYHRNRLMRRGVLFKLTDKRFLVPR